MRIAYKTPEFPEPGDSDLSKGIDEINKKNYKKAQTFFEKSATYGNEYGQLFCALIHFGGFDISKRNPTKALEYFQAAETQWKNKIAQFFIGIMYIAGDGVVLDGKTGWIRIEKSCENNCIIGKVLQARTLYDAAKDYKKAFYYFKQVVESDLYNNNTLCLFENINFKVNFDGDNLSNPFQIDDTVTLQPIYLTQYCTITASSTWNPYSLWYTLSNNPYIVSNCQVSIGSLYYSGLGDVEKDYQKSLEYFYKAAKNQNPLAYQSIGIQFEEGAGVDQDFAEAYKNHLKAVSLGDSESLLNIAIFHSHGAGVTYVNKEGVSRKGEAYLILGCLYRTGHDGIKQDYTTALKFFEKAWGYGNEHGAFFIGEIYDQGLGFKRDKDNATVWYLKSVSLNNYEAYYNLGLMELRCHKNREDLERALDYFRKAEKHGITKAQEMIDQITLLLFKNLRLSK